MKVVRLARFFEQKYGLVSTSAGKPIPAAVKKVDLNWIKKDLTDLVRTYIANPPSAYNIVPLLAQQFDDPDCQDLLENMVDIVKDIKKSTPKLLFHQVNSVLEIIDAIQKNRPEVRQRIHDYYTKTNDREMAKAKFETVVFEKIANILKQKAEELKTLFNIDDPILGGPIEGQRKELSKQEMWMFVHGHPVAQKYGLANLEIFGKIYEDLELRPKLTDIVLAANRGKSARNTSMIVKRITELMELYKQRQTNEDEFDRPSSQPVTNRLLNLDNHEQPEHVIEGDPNYADPSVLDPTEITRKQEQIKKEDEEKANRQKEWEAKTMSKYNSASLQRFLRKVQQ